jgi:hypothetical protein
MKTKFYPKLLVGFLVCWQLLILQNSMAQVCSPLTTIYAATESRCAATGSIQINASGGTGNFLYKVTGPISTNFSTDSIITGLPAGTYLVVIKDINTGCIYQNDSVAVPGNYQDPRFLMSKTDVTCINGSDGTITVYNQEFGRSPFTYTIVAPSASNVGVQNTTGVFTGLLFGNYMVQLTDSCGGIQNRSMTIVNYDWWINTYNVTKICDSVIVSITLQDSRGNTTPDSIFNLFSYGYVKPAGDTAWFSTPNFTGYIGNKTSLKLLVKDKCGNIKMVTWTNPNPVADVTVSISNKACSTFTAKAIAVGFTPKKYCLYSSANILISCNSTGDFANLAYGTYCIKVTGVCPDTTITRCFTVNRPVPSVDPKVNISDMTCTDFTASITGWTNLTNPNFCLYTSTGVLITCNTTGIFTHLLYGSYCIKITNDPSCYDTTITRCFTVKKPVPALDKVLLSDFTCKTFKATVITANFGAGWFNPTFCLYNAKHVLITCNTTGIFDSLLYGNYCVEVTNDPNPKVGCFDTTIKICFSAFPPKPSVSGTVKITAACNSFTAEISNPQNLYNPKFCLFDSAGVQLTCNSTGKFTNLAYGSYCIKVINDSTCYDTVITRCFTQMPLHLNFALSADKSCSDFGKTDIKVTISSGYPVYNIKVLNPAGLVVSSTTSPSGTTTISGLPGLPVPQQYTVIVTDQCGNKDTLYVTPVVSYITKTIAVNRKCPSGINPDGTADINVTATSNLGTITPRIIKKNNVIFSSPYDFHSGNLWSFYDLPPATYIIEYSFAGCSLKTWDTVAVPKYIYPDLSRSSAYNCDSNTISVGAVATGGISPFMYEIFQSVPALPSIITPLQSNPLFTFTNSTNYSLIRLRAIDACGNASIDDVSIMPLAPVVIIPPAGIYCLYQAITLKVDTIANATYKWYHKLTPVDSVLVSTTPSYYIPVLFPADTGDYVCVVSVNNYCLNRAATYHVGGNCGNVLPVDVQLKGYIDNAGAAYLTWDVTNETNVKEYVVERSSDKTNYLPIGKRELSRTGMAYVFKDSSNLNAVNYYRVKIITTTGAIRYSNAIALKIKSSGDAGISIYPNPVQQELNISFSGNTKNNYSVALLTAAGKKIYEKEFSQIQNESISIPRDKIVVKGLYIVVVTNLKTGTQNNSKVLFQ